MIEVKDLKKSYQRGVPVLKGLSFTLPETGFVCILGPSGCGKTSLLNAIGGLDRFDSGSLSTGDTTVRRYGTKAYEDARNRNFGYIFQNYYLLEDHSVAYNVYLGLHSLDLSHREKVRRVRQALQAVDMERFLRRKTSDLSGGQQQRVAIARALARRPRVIFADEPTGNLDDANTHNICSLLRQVSRESLVVMVTHEEHIARFYADRIITLSQGELQSDSQDWTRQSLRRCSDQEVYAGEYEETTYQTDRVDLRRLRSQDAAPVQVTVVAQKDKLILKVSDGRTVLLSQENDPPRIREGKCPELTLEQSQQKLKTDLFDAPPAPAAPAGKGLGLGMLLRQARSLMQGKGVKKRMASLFLALLTALTMVVVADFVVLSRVDPQDFIVADSHILVLRTQSTGQVPQWESPESYTWEEHFRRQFIKELRSLDKAFEFMGTDREQSKIYVRLFYQLDQVEMKVPAFSYVDISHLDESQLIYGRMPENSSEVVIDRVVLEAILKMEDPVAKHIGSIETFLNTTMSFGKLRVNPVIVGICDTGERSAYARASTRLAVSARGVQAITLEELQQQFPGKYDDLTIGDDECVVNWARAGEIWRQRVGSKYGSGNNQRVVRSVINEPELEFHVVVSGKTLEESMVNTLSEDGQVYCADKEAFLREVEQLMEGELGEYLRLTVSDPYAEKMAQYQAAASLRADGRSIVTFSVLVISAVMLYLLSRTRARERIGMLAVYRLLGIPRRKAVAVFALESVLSCLLVAVPVTVLTWLVLYVGANTPELGWPLLLPADVAAWALLAILVYHVLVSVAPLGKLLRLPPAQLAAKFDL